MNQKPKGGDIVLEPKSGCLFVSVHSRSKIYRPIPHEGNDDKFIRVESRDTDKLVVFNEENSKFVDVNNAFVAMKSELAKFKGEALKLESVEVPDVSMDKNATILLLAVHKLPVRIIAASKDASLKNLFDRTAETINRVVESSKNEQVQDLLNKANQSTKNDDSIKTPAPAIDATVGAESPSPIPAPAPAMRM